MRHSSRLVASGGVLCAVLSLSAVALLLRYAGVVAARPPPVPVTPYQGFSALLIGAPYLTGGGLTSQESKEAGR